MAFQGVTTRCCYFQVGVFRTRTGCWASRLGSTIRNLSSHQLPSHDRHNRHIHHSNHNQHSHSYPNALISSTTTTAAAAHVCTGNNTTSCRFFSTLIRCRCSENSMIRTRATPARNFRTRTPGQVCVSNSYQTPSSKCEFSLCVCKCACACVCVCACSCRLIDVRPHFHQSTVGPGWPRGPHASR